MPASKGEPCCISRRAFGENGRPLQVGGPSEHRDRSVHVALHGSIVIIALPAIVRSEFTDGGLHTVP
jgi:hypothetical protein